MKRCLIILCLVAWLVSPAWAATYYVAAATGSNANSGGSADPWKTITYALTKVSSGDTISVQPGLYDHDVNGETFPLTIDKAITLGASTYLLATIEGGGLTSSEAIIEISSGTAEAVISRFYIRPKTGTLVNNLISIRNASGPVNAQVDNCYLNGRDSSCGGINVLPKLGHGSLSQTNINRNIIINCSQYGIQLRRVNNTEINTVVNNTISNYGYGILVHSGVSAGLFNNILVSGETGVGIAEGATDYNITWGYNAAYDNTKNFDPYIPTSETNVVVNPFFVNAPAGNFRLQSKQEGAPSHSACIDGGKPTDDYSAEPTPNGSRNNMGANGNTTRAELSYGAITYYVDAVNGSDSNPGTTSDYPWKTITYALTQVATGDTVNVADGLYDQAGNGEAFPLVMDKPILLCGAGEALTTIEGSPTYDPDVSAVIRQTAGGTTTIEGFFITLATGYTANSLIKGMRGSPVGLNYFNNYLDGKNVASTRNGIDVAATYTGRPNVKIIKNVIINCFGGIVSFGPQDIQIINNTLSRNTSGVSFWSNVSAEARNNLLTSNAFGMLVESGSTGTTVNSTYTVGYSNVQTYGAGITTNETDLDSMDPVFVNSGAGNYRLQSITDGYAAQSPCIDLGDPNDDYSVEPSPNGSRINLGAYGSTATAEKSREHPITYYVDEVNGNNNYPGSATYPWKTITYALTRVATGDTVDVRAGLYDRIGNGEDFPLTINYPIMLSGAGFSTTTIEGSSADGSKLSSVIEQAAGGTTTVEGFFVTLATGHTANSLIISTSITPVGLDYFNNYLDGKNVANTRNGIDVGASCTSRPAINAKNNIITLCSNGINSSGPQDINIVNNTLVANNIGAFFGSNVSAEARNNILVGDVAFGLNVDTGSTGTTVNCTYTVGSLNGATYGAGITTNETDLDNITVAFVDPAAGNYRLQSITEGYSGQSPCIDLGDPNDAYSLEPSPNGSRINLGAYGNTATAEKSREHPITYYVDAVNGNNNYPGSVPYPWKTITYALTRVATGDTVNVLSGLYDRAGNGEEFPLTINYPIVLSGSGTTKSTIEGDPADLNRMLILADSGTTTVEGFSLVAKDGAQINTLIWYGYGNAWIKNNYINGKSTTLVTQGIGGPNGGITRRAELNIKNNVVWNCHKGMLPSTSVEANIINNTIFSCVVGIGFESYNTVTMRNNIVGGCVEGILKGTGGNTYTWGYNAGYQNTHFSFDPSIPTSETNVEINPYFVSTTEGNFRLMSSQEGYALHSPCIDGGDPTDAYSLEPSPNGSRINMGAYGNTATAELSWTAPTPDSITIAAPNGGEKWLEEEINNITWTSTGEIDYVKIEYSTNNFGAATTIVASTENDGTYAWTVPNDPSATVKVRISDTAIISTRSTSASNFEILPAAYRIASGQVLCYPTAWRPLRDDPVKMAYYLTSDQATRMVVIGVSGEIVYSGRFASGASGGQTGYNEITWNGRTSYGSIIGNGIYIIKLISGTRQIAKGHMVVLD